MQVLTLLSRPWRRLARFYEGDKARTLNGMLGFLLAVWTTHALLRTVWLFRNDAYGLPLVGKPDWYIFHAFCIDYLWIFGYSLPLVLIGSGWSAFRHWAWVLLALFHAALLLFTVLDQETMRFLGMHLDPTLMSTYGNPASIREVFHFVADDRSIRYLPYGLFFGSIPTAALLAWIFGQRFRWVLLPRLSGRVSLTLLLAAAVSWLYLNVIWTGGFRMLKLRPFIETAWMGWFQSQDQSPSDEELFDLALEYQDRWLAAQGDSQWVFTDPKHPYVRQTRESLCRESGPGQQAGLDCQADSDSDGVAIGLDCDDRNPLAHPGAADAPADGIDQDCDGVDAKPWNLALLIFESHRAVNCGHLMPFGAKAAATPFLDSLAQAGRFWTRFQVGGVPTINALIATHLGIMQHPTRIIASDFATMANQGFPAVLAQHGYRTDFFSAADPAWDNQTPWLRQWYQGFHYDRGRETDAAMMRHMAQWMKDSLRDDKPFFITSMSKTNHYPFNPVEGVDPLPADASLQDRMLATMRYADRTLAEFFASVKNESWFERTVFVIMGDHGFPMGEHGSATIGAGLYSESTWIPFVVFGAHPRLPTTGAIPGVANQIDIGPTFLDLAGIRTRNHYMGHSLLKPATGKEKAMVLRGEQGVLFTPELHWHLPWGDAPREQGDEVFDHRVDPGETKNLMSQYSQDKAGVLEQLKRAARLHQSLLESERLWPRAQP